MQQNALWAARVNHFLGVRKAQQATKDLYRLRVEYFLRWSERESYDPALLTTGQFVTFIEHLRSIPHKPSTIEGEVRVLRLFYAWLLSEDIVAVDPTNSVHVTSAEPQIRDTLTIAQMASLWKACTNSSDRAVVGLLGVCAVRPSELCDAKVQDFSIVDGRHVLRIPSRAGVFEPPYAAVPDEIFEAVVPLIADRRSGALLHRKDGQPLDRRTQLRWVKRIGRSAGIPFEMTALTLSFSLRALAIEHGFSYVSVIRTVAEIESRRLAKWVARAPDRIEGHAAFRMARLVIGSGDEAEDHLANARAMLFEGDTHPAASVAFAGATLERHLRALSDAHGLVVGKKEPTLSSYAAVLRQHRKIRVSDVQRIAQIQDHRNDAAHGWFTRVTDAVAEWTIRECSSFIKLHPLESVPAT